MEKVFENIVNEGITHIFPFESHGYETGTEPGQHGKGPALQAAEDKHVTVHTIGIHDFTGGIGDLVRFNAVIDQLLTAGTPNLKIAIHCTGGTGRTGMELVSLMLRD